LAQVVQQKNAALFTSKVLSLLDALQQTQEGAAIYEHVKSILEFYEIDARHIHEAYANLLRELLDAYLNLLPDDSPLRVHLVMVQKRLMPPLTISELSSLREYINSAAEKINQGSEAGFKSLEKALVPLLQSFGIKPSQARLVQAVQDTSNRKPSTTTPEESAGTLPDTNRRVDITYRQHLDEKRQRIQEIQEILAHHVSEVVKQNEEFGVLLEVEHEALQQTNNLEEVKTLKDALINEVEKLLKGHSTLTNKLDSANKYLQIIETEGQHLNEELTRVHILSLTDELTELPNRRAFLRRLEDEVARVQRYGYPLSLALIDLDGFKSVNDQFGHAAGDEVLNSYAANILSIFRHHDMVARYGGEEFAVLLPNTNTDGAMQALKKVQKRTAETTFLFEGIRRPMPTFSAGLSLYKPGETPSNLIERADKALYQAKNLGRNRIEVHMTEGIESSSG
jgi:diguanylate cyclase